MLVNPKISNFKTIAIIHTAFIGDVTLVLYLADYIKKIHLNAELILVTTPVSKSLGDICDAIDETIVYDKRYANKGISGIFQISDILKERNVDLIIAPHKSLRTTLLSFFSRAEFSVGFAQANLSFLYKFREKYRNDLNEINRNLSLLNCFEFDKTIPQNNIINLRLDNKTIENVNKSQIAHNLYNNYIVIAPGSVWSTKRWSVEYFVELVKMIEKTGVKCVLSGSKSDVEICTYIAENTNSIDLSGKTSIPETILLLKNATLLITNDSAPIHFAGLVKCRTIAIFGPTIPEFGFAPTGKDDIVIENKEIKCRPCGMHGHKICPIKTHICMTSIKPDKVYKQIESIICK